MARSLKKDSFTVRGGRGELFRLKRLCFSSASRKTEAPVGEHQCRRPDRDRAFVRHVAMWGLHGGRKFRGGRESFLGSAALNAAKWSVEGLRIPCCFRRYRSRSKGTSKLRPNPTLPKPP